MKTVQELIQATTQESLYQPKSFTQNNGIKDINEVRFQDVVENLEPDEDILFCLPYNFTSCVAFTNKRIIDAAKMNDFFQANMTNTYSYESVNAVQGFANYLVIKITGEADHMYAPLKGREQVAFAVKRINEAIYRYKKQASAPAAPVVVNNLSAAEELKKFKELLDCGIITQGEFDAKKQQLLGINAGATVAPTAETKSTPTPASTAPTTQIAFCPGCGRKFQDQERFCIVCGTKR